jgi:hypothetical protein
MALIGVRLLHIVSSMLSASHIVTLALISPEDIGDVLMFRNKTYRSVVHWAGLLMIFSGAILVLLMKQSMA